MSDDAGTTNVDRLLRVLRETLGDSLRSCVEYTPQTTTVHYVRDGIDERTAQSRLVRLGELYHSERLSARPASDDPGFGPLYASVHVFGGSTVVHLVDPAGVVVGFSMDHGAVEELLAFVREAVEALYGSVPDDLRVA